MIPGKFEEEKNDEDCVVFQPPNSITNLEPNVLLLFVPLHSLSTSLYICPPPSTSATSDTSVGERVRRHGRARGSESDGTRERGQGCL